VRDGSADPRPGEEAIALRPRDATPAAPPRVIGVDVGGTFTDCVVLDGDRLELLKLPTTADDPAAAVLAAVRSLDPAGEAAVVHGSTVATNALLERRGARTVFLTTAGFGDLLTLGRGARTALYDLAPDPLPNLVADGDVVELPERVVADGSCLRPLTPRAAAVAAGKVRTRGAEAAAVCCLFSYLHPDHERAVGGALARRAPTCFTSLSVDVLPEFREYERATATVVNAYVGPRTSRYLHRLHTGLDGRRLAVMGSHGGTLAPEVAARLPLTMILSGPAAGVTGALAVARRAGLGGILTFDMGGTSTDVSVAGERLPLTQDAVLDGLPIQRQIVDVHTVGAGGGSLLHVDAGGAVRVGPRSAGASPGPAAYGRGGTQATITDAHVVLGRLPGAVALGGRAMLDVAAAWRAIGRLADAAGLSAADAARTALDVADATMEHALRTVSVRRGVDPATLTLVAFGGAGGLHACRLAERLGIRRICIPAQAGALSALGLAVAVPAVSVSRSVVAGGRPAEWRGVFATLAHEAGAALARLSGAATARVERSADVRYASQSWSLTVPWPADGRIERAFTAAHRARFGFVAAEPVAVVTLRVRAIGTEAQRPIPAPACGGGGPWPRTLDSVLDDGTDARVPVVERASLAIGADLVGPAILVQQDATTWVAAGWRGRVGPAFDMRLDRP